jgi:hypothetical protein
VNEAEFREILNQLPDTIKNWIESIRPLAEVKSLSWENETLPDMPVAGWQVRKVGTHKTVTVTFPHKSGDITFTKRFVRLDEMLLPDEPFQQATRILMNTINPSPNDRKAIRQFLCTFAEHVVSNVASIDLERLSMQEIVERIPDMDLA